MPKKEESPLAKVQHEGDEMKKKVDSYVSECQAHINDPKADRNTTKKMYKRCTDLQTQVNALHQKTSKLKEVDEPIKVDKYKEKHRDEMRRIQNFQKTLETYSKGLKNMHGGDNSANNNNDKMEKVGVEVEETEDSEDDSEDEDEDDEEEDEEEEESEEGETVDDEEEETVDDEEESADDEEESTEDEEEEESGSEDYTGSEDESEGLTTGGFGTGTNQIYEAISDFEGKKKGDLSITEGEILKILDPREDGWWLAENEEGEKGVVPVTYLQVSNKYKALEQQQERRFPQPSEASIDGTYDDEDDEPKTPRSGRALWKNIKQAVKELEHTVILSAIHDPSTKDEYSLKNYLTPKLSPSCVGFRDLFFDNITNKIRSRASRILRVVTISACRQIPPPGTGVEINSRHVRVCLFDGQNVLSNVHTMRCVSVDKEQRTWNFSNRADSMNTLEFAEFFVRSTQTDENIGLLFELCISYTRASTNQDGEFSCGWVHLPLFDVDGQAAPNKTFDLHVNGGTPYEKGVEVDPSVGRKGSSTEGTIGDNNSGISLRVGDVHVGTIPGSSMLRSLIAGNKQPRLVVRVNLPTREQKDLIETLPDVCIAGTTSIQYLSFYRQMLTDALLRDTDDVMCIEPVHSPVLNLFPEVTDQPDLMDVLRSSWAERMKTAKRVEKKDPEAMKEMFKKVFMEKIYPLCTSASLPLFRLGHIATEKKRQEEIARLRKLNATDSKLPVPASLLSPDCTHAPFDISEIAFSVIGQRRSPYAR